MDKTPHEFNSPAYGIGETLIGATDDGYIMGRVCGAQCEDEDKGWLYWVDCAGEMYEIVEVNIIPGQ